MEQYTSEHINKEENQNSVLNLPLSGDESVENEVQNITNTEEIHDT